MKPTRRELLVGGAALALAPAAMAAEPAMRTPKKPKALRPGDKIMITAPAGAADGPEHLERAASRVRSLGFEPVISPNAGKRFGYLAGTEQERADDINLALRDSSIRGIFYLRGGYGAMRILPLLDYKAMARDPKVTMGFSDITALHLAFLRQSRVVTYHGPCAESSWSEFSRSTLPVVTSAQAFGPVLVPATNPLNRQTFVPGRAEGRLVGGNLTLVASLAGTPYGAQLKGAVLVLEDIGEEPYRVDRMLTQLLLTGGLKECAAIVFGDFRDRPRPGDAPETNPERTFSLEQVLRDRTAAAGVPSYWGLNFGHIGQNHILPLGCRARVDADTQSLELLESAVSV